jgi:coenzyme Q-binding protein COQ10
VTISPGSERRGWRNTLLDGGVLQSTVIRPPQGSGPRFGRPAQRLMPKLDFDRHVPFAPARMFALVADLESYPNFIPNCRAMDVRPDRAAPESIKFARMTLSFGPVTQAYTSRVALDPRRQIIDARATDGPFSYLVSQWRFEPEGSGAKIHFDIDFKISNPLIAAVAEPAFAAKQREIMDAFVTEAERRYGGA